MNANLRESGGCHIIDCVFCIFSELCFYLVLCVVILTKSSLFHSRTG